MWLVNTSSKHKTLTQCWPTVRDTGPVSNQHWFNTSCLLGRCLAVHTAGREYKPTPTQCLLNVVPASPVLASIHSVLVSTSCWRDCVHIAYTAPMPFKVGQRCTQWPGMGLMHVTPTHCRLFCETQWRHSVKTRLYNTPSPILHSVKRSDVTRWKQGYLRTLPHTSLY